MNKPTDVSRRTTLQAGAASLVGLSAAPSMVKAAAPKPKNVIFVFLTGGLAHHDTWDMKPDAPDNIRGEFKPIATKTPGLQIGEHMPLLAQRSHRYALVRSMETASNGHEPACHMLLTGRLDLPTGFSLTKVPNANEWPSIPSVITYAMHHKRKKMPPAVVLPEPSVNEAGRVRPGQYAGRLGNKYESWHINIAAKCPLGNGACPDCFRFDGSKFTHAPDTIFDTPTLGLPEGGQLRFKGRVSLLDVIQGQQRQLEEYASRIQVDQHRQQAISILSDPTTSSAFDVENADPKLVAKYGKNKFGLSCLMAKRLSEAGVRYVQVNLGKNSSWDTHARNFPNLKNNLLPPMDKAVSALMDDIHESGMWEDTFVVVTGEFGRTPKINKNGGRDHWGPCNTMLLRTRSSMCKNPYSSSPV